MGVVIGLSVQVFSNFPGFFVVSATYLVHGIVHRVKRSSFPELFQVFSGEAWSLRSSKCTRYGGSVRQKSLMPLLRCGPVDTDERHANDTTAPLSRIE